jgi:hypothetical protein
MKKEYIPFIQQPCCCGPCSMQWVLYRRKLPLLSQEEIGKFFDLRVPAALNSIYKEKFSNKKTHFGSYGTEDFNEKSINAFFKKYKYPLKGQFFEADKISDSNKFLTENFKNDILVIFHRAGIKNQDKKTGHVAIVADFNTKTKEVTIGDPNRDFPKFWKVKLDELIGAMSPKFDGKQRSFIVISEK